MQAHVVAALVALCFSLLVVAGPVALDKATDLTVRSTCGSACNGAGTQLQAVLALFINLQTEIDSILVICSSLKATTNISSYCNQIVVLINACLRAVVKLNLSASVFTSLSVADQACVRAIAQICAEIIFSLQTHFGVFSSLVLGNTLGLLALGGALVQLVTQFNVCVGGFIGLVAKICTSFDLRVSAGLCLTAVIRLLGL